MSVCVAKCELTDLREKEVVAELTKKVMRYWTLDSCLKRKI